MLGARTLPAWAAGLQLCLAATATAALRLNVTALTAHNGASALECWRLDAAFVVATEAGVSGSVSMQMGDLANMSLSVLPAGYDAGLHNAPYNQWVVYTSGMALITLPEDNSTATGAAYVQGGEFGLLFAADTAAVSRAGHRTRYPGVTETVALQIPTANNSVPAHDVLHAGPCNATETMGLKAEAMAS